MEVSVLPNCLAINATLHSPDSTHDIEMFKLNVSFHKTALKKTDEELE